MGVNLQKMKALEIESNLQRWLTHKSGYRVVAIEYAVPWGRADVFGVRKTNYSVEFEIKVSKADLMGELNSIMRVKGNRGQADLFSSHQDRHEVEKKCKKLKKHCEYLRFCKLQSAPNFFSFVVPEGPLVDIALDALEDTPYGLMVAKPASRDQIIYDKLSLAFDIIKKPKSIKLTPFNDFMKIMRHLSLDNMNLQKRLAEAKAKIK